MIGITPNYNLVYEGESTYGHAIWPSPTITRATLIKQQIDWTNLPSDQDVFSLIFREDSFDAVTRVRRGRLYQPWGAQPTTWSVKPHPAYYNELREAEHRGGWIQKPLNTYETWNGTDAGPTTGVGSTLVLGTKEFPSIWTIVGAERTFGREILLTLRSRSTLGILPALAEDEIPPSSRAAISEALKKLTDVAFRGSAESVVDRCRDATQVILSNWLAHVEESPKFLTIDLGTLVQRFDDTKHKHRSVLASAARIVARLHSRAKPNEQLQHNVSAPSESDAETAITLTGLILREIGWATKSST